MNNKIIEKIKGSGTKLLIADDEKVICDSLKKVAEMFGFEVHTASNGTEAWETYKQVSNHID